MHPLLTITKLDAGGMERFGVTVCNAWAVQGRGCTVCALHPAAPGASREWLSPDVAYVELHRPARFAAPALMRMCRKHPDDPVLAVSLEIAAVLLALKRLSLIRNPVVYRESTAVLAHHRGGWRWIVGWVASRADGLIVQSRQALAELRQLGSIRGAVRVIRNPYGLPCTSEAPVCRRPVPREGLHLLSVGRLEPMKGHERLIRAMPALRHRFPGVRLSIAGQGSQSDRLQGRIRQLGLEDCVSLLGHVPQPERLYREADLLVLPSFYEGLPNVVIEALALACPVVAAAGAGGTPEFMEELGLGAFLVPDADFEERLPDAVEKVLTSGTDVWRRARERLQALTAPEVVADQVWELLFRLARTEGRAGGTI